MRFSRCSMRSWMSLCQEFQCDSQRQIRELSDEWYPRDIAAIAAIAPDAPITPITPIAPIVDIADIAPITHIVHVANRS